MNQLFNSILCNLDIAGILLLFATLLPLRKLIHELPHGSMRKLWLLLTGMVIFFIITYIVLAIQFRTGIDFLSREIICAVLFFGALFVFKVSILSMQTTRDIKRIYTLEIENITDPLMKISNRRYLEQKLQEEFLKAKRYNLDFSILMIDIDHFKNVNDTYGHNTGDIVLIELGIIIKNLIRTYDTVARYGGEEIMVLCPLTDGEHTVLLAERLRQEIEQSTVMMKDKQEIHITISIGVCECTDEISCVEDLIRYADQAMYHVKENGRNGVYLYNGLIKKQSYIDR